MAEEILKPVNMNSIGGNDDPCFGKGYDLSTTECKQCGDSELCCLKFSQLVGKTRKQLEKDNQFKDLEILVDEKAVKKTIRALKRKGEDKKAILDKLQAKYEISHKIARMLYRKLTNNK